MVLLCEPRAVRGLLRRRRARRGNDCLLYTSCSFNPLATCHTYEPASWVADASAYVSEGRCYKDLVLPSAVTDEQGRLLQEYYVGSVTKDEIIQRLDEVYAQAIAG